MENIHSIEQLFSINASIRNKSRKFITNFYFEELRHSIWINKQTLFYEWVGDTCFLFRKNASFWNAFYISTDIEELNSSLNFLAPKLNDQTLIFDLVGKKNTCEQLEASFLKHGFSRRSSLVRFSKINTCPIENDTEIEKVQRATLEQAKEANKLLHQYMDERIEQIPDMEEYEEWQKLGHILVYLVDNSIAGLFDYEQSSSTTFPRHWLVHPNHRGHHIGTILFRRFLYESNSTKRIVSWVIENNAISIRNHHLTGFKEENLYDYIMSNK